MGPHTYLEITLHWRRYNVMTSHQHWYYVVLLLCVSRINNKCDNNVPNQRCTHANWFLVRIPLAWVYVRGDPFLSILYFLTRWADFVQICRVFNWDMLKNWIGFYLSWDIFLYTEVSFRWEHLFSVKISLVFIGSPLINISEREHFTIINHRDVFDKICYCKG